MTIDELIAKINLTERRQGTASTTRPGWFHFREHSVLPDWCVVTAI